VIRLAGKNGLRNFPARGSVFAEFTIIFLHK